MQNLFFFILHMILTGVVQLYDVLVSSKLEVGGE